MNVCENLLCLPCVFLNLWFFFLPNFILLLNLPVFFQIPRKKKQPAAKKRSSKEKIFTVDSDVMSMTKSDCHAANNSTKEVSIILFFKSKLFVII